MTGGSLLRRRSRPVHAAHRRKSVRSAVRARRPDRRARRHAPLVRHERVALLHRHSAVHESGGMGRRIHWQRHRRTFPASAVGVNGRMSSYLEESLAPGETIVARFHLHWTAKGRLILGIVLIPVIVGIPLAIYEWLRLRAIEFGVTTHRGVRK